MKLLKNVINLAKDIYTDKRLLIDLSIKDVQRKFSGTYFGLFWGFLQPVMNIIIYWIVFQFAFRSGDVEGVPFVLWFISGMVCWLFISESFSSASNSLLEYNYLIQKVKFNIDILPLVKIISSFYIHLFFLVIVLVICAFWGYWPTIKIIQLIYYMFSTIMFVFSLSLLTSSVMVFFRDLNQMISIILMIGMWSTPICWNMDNFDSSIQKILKLNPFYYLVEGYRDAILGRKWFSAGIELNIYFWVVTLLILFIGVYFYIKLKPHFADTV